MMQITTRFNVLNTYEFYDYFIDIVLDKDSSELEAWLRKDRYGYKSFMFGCTMKQKNYEGMTFCDIYNDFEDMVLNSVDEYIELYEQDLEDFEYGFSHRMFEESEEE